jgi:hypothetical protein
MKNNHPLLIILVMLLLAATIGEWLHSTSPQRTHIDKLSARLATLEARISRLESEKLPEKSFPPDMVPMVSGFMGVKEIK